MGGYFLHNLIVGLCMQSHLACNVPDTALIQGIFGYCGTTKVVAIPLYTASYPYQRVLLGID